MDWKVNKLILTNSENGRNIVLGDVVAVSQVVYRTVAVYDDDSTDPTIRSDESVIELANYRIVRKHESVPVDGSINGLVVGFRFLPECQVMTCVYEKGGKTTTTPRKPYLLVCFWPTHKPVLVDPDFAFTADFLKFHVDWRKQLSPHPDKVFWNQVGG